MSLCWWCARLSDDGCRPFHHLVDWAAVRNIDEPLTFLFSVSTVERNGSSKGLVTAFS